jgi:P27 family predicted phage terminase small subunit
MGGKGSGGRNAKPSALRKLQNNPGKRRINKREPKVPVGAPEMPTYLSATARAEWKRLVPILLGMKVLTPNHGAALAGLCCAHAQFVEAQRDLARRGNLLEIYEVCRLDDLVNAKAKQVPKAVLLDVKKNPSVQIASDADRRLRSYYAMFGLDPVSQTKLSVHANPDETPDAFEAFLSSGAQSRPN